VGLFPVTILDRQVIRRGLQALPHDERRVIEEEAARQIRRLSAATARLAQHPFIDDWSDRDVDTLVQQFCLLPCPALKADGSCGVYAHRPLVCRSMGIPPEVDGVVQGSCAVQTSVPVIRLHRTLREEEDALLRREADELSKLREQLCSEGEELLLPHAFVAILPKDARR
jgi:Fe-S-cluster containining protein